VTRRRCYPLSSSRRAPVGLEQLRRLPPVIETGPAPASEIRGRTRQALRSCEGCSGQWPTSYCLFHCPSVAPLPDSGRQQRIAVAEARGAVPPNSGMGATSGCPLWPPDPAPLLEIREARSCTTPVDTIHENPRPQFFWSKARRKLSRQAVTLFRRQPRSWPAIARIAPRTAFSLPSAGLRQRHRGRRDWL
jgi:hypothetical protein